MAAKSEANRSSLNDGEVDALDATDLRPGMTRPGAGVAHEEGILTAWDGLDLFWQTWAPEGEAVRGVIALMHGMGEHSARYHHVATLATRAGYAVGAIDARGHGRSAGPRGHVGRFEEFPRDLDRWVGDLEERWPSLPLYVLGHSNGGLISLHHALMAPGRANAYAVSSPFLGFEVKVPPLKALAAPALSRLWPTFGIPTELDPAVLCHDEAVVAQYAADPMVGQVASPRWYTETRGAQAELLKRASQIRVPFLFLVAGSDALAEVAATERVYAALGSRERELEIFPSLKHEILNEAEWDAKVRTILKWYERFR